jgi:hypothetical protein
MTNDTKHLFMCLLAIVDLWRNGYSSLLLIFFLLCCQFVLYIIIYVYIIFHKHMYIYMCILTHWKQTLHCSWRERVHTYLCAREEQEKLVSSWIIFLGSPKFKLLLPLNNRFLVGWLEHNAKVWFLCELMSHLVPWSAVLQVHAVGQSDTCWVFGLIIANPYPLWGNKT